MGLRSRWKSFHRWSMDTIARWLSHILVPEIASVAQREIDSDAFENQGEVPQTIRIEDNGASTTIVSFSSGGFIHSGLPTYAFGKLLAGMKEPCNIIFIRDLHRVAYHLLPNGEPGGLEFYEREIKEALRKLGSTTTHMIGESSGAAAAVYFGTLCGAKRVLAMTMPFPMEPWSTPRALFRHLFNLRELFRDRRSYWDSLMISAFSFLARRTLLNHIGEDGIFNPIETYRNASIRPGLTLIYGERCDGDATNARLLEGMEDVELIPLPTGRHTLWIPLARLGSIGTLIEEKLLGTKTEKGVEVPTSKVEQGND